MERHSQEPRGDNFGSLVLLISFAAVVALIGIAVLIHFLV
jgi:hypothetical protein